MPPDGVPIPPDWHTLCKFEDEAELQERDYCSKDETHMYDHEIKVGGIMQDQAVISIFCEEQKLIPQNDLKDFKTPRERRLHADSIKLAGKTTKDAIAKQKLKKETRAYERKKITTAIQQIDFQWKDFISNALAKATRAELMRKMEPQVGKVAKKNMKKTLQRNIKQCFYKKVQE